MRLDGALVLPFDFRVFTEGPLPRYGSGQGLGVPRVFERRLRLIPPAGYRFRWRPLAHTTDGPIAITIDDGPVVRDDVTADVLDVLARYHAKAVFFVEGKDIVGRTSPDSPERTVTSRALRR